MRVEVVGVAKPNIKGIRDTNWRMEWDDVDPDREVKLTTQFTIERAVKRRDDGKSG